MTTCQKEESFKAIQDFDKETVFESWSLSKFAGFEADNALEHDMAIAVLQAREPNSLKRQRFVQGRMCWLLLLTIFILFGLDIKSTKDGFNAAVNMLLLNKKLLDAVGQGVPEITTAIQELLRLNRKVVSRFQHRYRSDMFIMQNGEG